MQRYTILSITVSALHVSGGFFAHHQELKNYAHSIWYMSSLLAATTSYTIFFIIVSALRVSGGETPQTCRALTIIKNIV
jgi:hypothetical protein